MSVTIEDLPDEILEYIFYLLPPYEDLKNCRTVNHKWNRMASNVISRIRSCFGDALSSQNVTIESQSPRKDGITKRYAHSACRYHDCMYIFGGFTSSFSSLNDLWKLDFSTRGWTRIRADGKCPIPKAGATIVTFENKLILFGGILPHAHDSYNDIRRMSNSIHTFDVMTDTWDEVTFGEDIRVPGLARHSATVHNHMMIIFGGLDEMRCVNDLYVLNLRTMDWQHVPTLGEKPTPRFGQSQIFIDDTHLLILGGIYTDTVIFDDAWLLDMSNVPWRWSKVDIGAHVQLIRSVWCHPVCKVGKYIVTFKPSANNPSMYTDWFPIPLRSSSDSTSRKIYEETNVNGKRGVLRRSSSAIANAPSEGRLRHNITLSHGRELRSLNTFKTSMELHMLDTSYLLEHGRLVHVRGKLRPFNCPSDTILYSVVEGNGELLVFGGIQRNVCKGDDGRQEIIPEIMNTLKIIKLKKKVV